MDSVLTQKKCDTGILYQGFWVANKNIIFKGSSDSHSSFQLVIQTFQFPVTSQWLIRDFSVTLQSSVFQFTEYITKPVW